jgi:3-dehydroquinate synthetase
MENNKIIAEYLKMTGQTKQELYSGAQAFGMAYINTELIPKAIKEKKKIVWKDEFDKGIDAMSFTLEKL